MTPHKPSVNAHAMVGAEAAETSDGIVHVELVKTNRAFLVDEG
jgi:hypothetical protein